jgi:hypothetical protein
VVNFLFSWDDIKKARTKLTNKEVVGLAVVNDEIKEPKSELIEALNGKGSQIIFWKKREEEESLQLLSE